MKQAELDVLIRASRKRAEQWRTDNPDRNATSYKDRSRILRSIGYATYKEYLKTPLWATIRACVFRNKGNRCCICQERADVIHHSHYSKAIFAGSSYRYLYPICRECHTCVEYKDGKKLRLDLVRCVFKKALRAAGVWDYKTGNRVKQTPSFPAN